MLIKTDVAAERVYIRLNAIRRGSVDTLMHGALRMMDVVMF